MQPNQSQSSLEELARRLALNAIDISAEKGTGEESFVLEKIASPELASHRKVQTIRKHRNILIVGAGASHNANKNIFLAPKVAEEIKKSISGKYGENITEFVNNELSYLTQAFGLAEEEFETIMLACSRLDRKHVLAQLQENYDYKHVINISYEIIAHLFKHRFIDVIINFNFDEILDNAIEEEMVGSSYKFIYSDGHCEEDYEDLLVEGRLKMPIYIKPHGTISHPSSLKFNKEHYYNMPTRILEYLYKILEAKNDEEAFPFLDLNIISVGYGMQSLDLNSLLNKALLARREKGSSSHRVYVFDTASEESYKNKIAKIVGLKEELGKIKYIQLASSDDNEDGDLQSLDKNFSTLWKYICDNFQKDARNDYVRGIERHEFTQALFQDDKKERPLRIFRNRETLNESSIDRTFKYLRSRIYFETAVLLMSSDGLINLAQLREGRPGKYFRLLQECYRIVKASKDEKKIYLDILNNLKEGVWENSFYDFIKAFDFGFYKGFVKDSFICNLIESEMKKKKEQRFLYIAEKLKEILEKIGLVKCLSKEIYLEYSERIKKSKPLMVKADFEEYKISKFNQVTDKDLLFTDMRFTLKRRMFFDDEALFNGWNVVLAITEDAWLFYKDYYKKRIAEGKKIVGLVLAATDEYAIDNSFENFNQFNIIAEREETNVRRLPWWLHNQHLMLFLKCEAKENDSIKTKFLGGLYYQRRLLSKNINPIYVEAEEDCKQLYEIFINYWHRATQTRLDNGSAVKFVSENFKDFDEFDDVRKNFESLIYRQLSNTNK